MHLIEIPNFGSPKLRHKTRINFFIHLVLLPPGVRLGGGLLQLEAEVLGAAQLLLMLLPQTLTLQCNIQFSAHKVYPHKWHH